MMLVKKHKDLVLLIAGGGHPKMEKLFSGKENIILTGSKDNLVNYYQAMDIYVLPSLTETTSLTTLEAMACGLPVVVTPVGFIREYINDGVNGMLFPKNNSHSLYLKLDYLLKHPDMMEKLGKKARETVVEKFSWDRTSENIKKIFNAHAAQSLQRPLKKAEKPV
jgi:glycosyltransferase involved in cell wall biosynthesis